MTLTKDKVNELLDRLQAKYNTMAKQDAIKEADSYIEYSFALKESKAFLKASAVAIVMPEAGLQLMLMYAIAFGELIAIESACQSTAESTDKLESK